MEINPPLDSTYLLKLLLKKKKTFLILGVITAVTVALATLLMPNYYESTVTFFPSNPTLTDRNALFQKDNNQTQNTFGDKNDADRLISIGRSGQINAYCINAFKLFEHYQIDSTAQYAQFKMRAQFNKNYEILKNGLGGVEVHVLDCDPQLAADMANAIVKKIDEISTGMVVSNKQEIVKMFEQELGLKKTNLIAMQDSLVAMRGYVTDTVQLNIQKMVLRNAVNDYNDISTLFNQNQASASKNLSSVYIVEKAFASDKKVKPVRSLLVLGITAFVLSCTLLFFVLMQRLKTVDWSE